MASCDGSINEETDEFHVVLFNAETQGELTISGKVSKTLNIRDEDMLTVEFVGNAIADALNEGTRQRGETLLSKGRTAMSENQIENDTPVSDTLLVMTATSLDNSDLSPRELMIARIAALVAVDASAASYVLNAMPAADSGITVDDVEDILIAVAPVVGTARIVSATANIAEGLGFVIALAEGELEEEEVEAEAEN